MIWTLLIIFTVKHFIADYPLQNSYMLRKFMPGWGFFLPLAAHAGVHAFFTLVIALCVDPLLAWLAAVDFFTHFAMDRLKAGPKYMGRWKSLSLTEFYEVVSQRGRGGPDTVKANARLRGNKLFWQSLGLDQMVHHLVDLFSVYMLVG